MTYKDLTLPEQAVLATLSYHDQLEMPLTGMEVWRYLFRAQGQDIGAVSLGDTEATLSGLVEKGLIFFHWGYYVFPGREKTIHERIRKHALAQTKWPRLRTVAWLLQAVPFLEMVAASGSLTREVVSENSDLDVLLVTASGRIWTVRFVVTVLLDALRLRRRPTGPTKNRVCLNHYLTEDSLELPYQSLYTALEYARIIPLFGEKVTWRFREKNRLWMEKYLINVFPDSVSHIKTVSDFPVLSLIKRIGGLVLGGTLGDFIERRLGELQKKKIAEGDAFNAVGGRVIASSSHLEFHPRSREAPLLNLFNIKMEQFGMSAFGHQKDSGLS